MLTVFRAASKAAGSGVEDVGRFDRIGVQVELGDVALRVDDVADQLVVRVGRVGGEEGVTLGPFDAVDPAEDGNHRRLVAVADVVLATGRRVGLAGPVVAGRGQDHVGRIDVGAVGPLGETEGEDRTLGELVGGFLPGRFVLRLEDRTETEDRDLPRVPVGQPVEGGELVEFADPRGVPAPLRIPVAVTGRGQEGLEDAEVGLHLEELRVPVVLPVVVLQRLLAAVLEPLDHRLQPLLVRSSRCGADQVDGLRIRPSPGVPGSIAVTAASGLALGSMP